MNDNRTILYNALKNEGYTDIGNNQEFNKLLENPDNLRLAYDAMRNSGYTDIGESFEDFNALINPAREAVGYTAKPTRDYSQPTEAQREYESRGGFEPIGQGKVKLGETETPVFVGAGGEWRVPSPVMLNKEEEIFRHGNPSESEKNEFVRNEERKYRGNLASNVDAMQSNLSSLMEKQRLSDIKMHNRYKESQSAGEMILDAVLGIPVAEAPWMLGVIPSSQLDASPEGVASREANASLTAAGRKWNEAQAIIKAAKSGNFAGGLGEALSSIDTWSSDQRMRDAVVIQRVVDKWEKKGEGCLTESEMALLDAIALNAAVAEEYGDELSAAYNAGKMVGEMASFMIEMAMNPLSGLSKKAANKIADRAVKKFGELIGKSAAKRMAVTTAARGVGSVAGAVAGGTGMALTTGLPSVGVDVAERVTGKATYGVEDGKVKYAGNKEQEDLGTALYKSVTSRMLDNASEMLGAGYVNAPLKWLARTGKGTKLLGWMDNLANSKFGKAMSEFAEKTNWHGPIEEFLEEVHVGLADPVLVGDQTWGEFFTKKNLGTIAIGVAVPGVAMSTLSTLAGVADGSFKAGAAERMKMQNADIEAMQLWERPEEWDDLRRSLTVGSLEDIDSKLSEVYNDKTLTPEQKTRAIEYAIYNLQYRTARGVADAMSEGRMSGIDNMLHDVYGTAYSERISPARANESFRAWENAGKEVTAILGLKDQSVEDWLGGRTVEEAANGDKAVLDALTAYETAKADFEGRRDRYQQDKQRAYSESDKAIDKMANNGIVYSTQLGGQTVNITGGDVVLNENGTVDYESSSDAFYVTMPDGTVRVMASENIPGMVLAENAEELKANERAKIDERWRVEFDAAEMAEQTATPSDQVSDQVAQPVTPTANSFTLEENGTVNSVEVLDESGDVARVSINGQEVEMSHEWLAEARAAAGVEQETEQAAAPATALERVPKDENGEPIYEQVDSDTAWDAIVEQTEGDVEMAQAVANGMVADKEVALKKLEKAKSKGGVTIAEKIAAEKERKAKIEAAKQELAKWQEIAGVAASRKAAPDINDAIKTETVATEAENRTEPTKKVEESSKSVLNDGLQLIEAPTEVTEFDTADEFVAGLLGGIKITPESFRKETGLGIDEQRKLVGIIAGEDKGGVSVERASEIIAENYAEELAASGFHGDVQDIRNMLIDILSSGNPKTYIKQSKERRAAEWVEQETARADAWAEERFGFASYADMLMYEETALERIEEKYRGFDEQEYFNILAENYNYDTRRESERVGNGSEVLQGERAVPSPRTENIGERNEGAEVRYDVQGGDKTADAQEQEVVGPVERIEDVGEKIGGAKKDKLRETIDRMKADMELSDETLIDKIAKFPISKIFNFDFQKLREGGMPNEAISFMEIVKKSIPAKPRTSHKVRRWVNNTLALYKLCLEVGTNWDKVNTILTSRDFAGTDLKAQFDAYMSIGGFDSGLNIGNAKLKQLDKTAGYYKDGKFISSEGKWYVRDAGKHGGIYDTKEDAVEALKAFAGDNAGTTESGKKKEVKFAVYQRREDKSIFIAIKGKSDIVIQDGFKSAKEAFDYIGANNAELQSRYRNLLDKTNADFEENRERKGRDYRNGKDITAEEFRNTFGFRGVEFGNWMTQEDRRKAINECYDALMDLAAVCKVSPKALSLNGTLGMAFGSRGGGKFSAHYEPGKVVINLTKTRGAGTLAHEWFHAIDNYFAKMGETEYGYATGGEGMLPKGIQKYGKRYYDRNRGRVITEEEYNELAKEHAVRREMVDAWEHLMESLKNSDYYKRSNAYARLHNSKYWNDPTELGARAFSVWVENELSKQDTSNDYLANNPRYVKAEVTDAQDKYMPYPFDTDADWMDEAFGNLFEVMQEKETEDGNVVLYRQGEGSLSEGVVVMDSDVYSKALGKTRYYGKKQSDYVARVRKKMEQQAHELAAKLNTPVEVRESADGLSGKKSKAKGWYDVKSGKIVVVVSNHSSVADIQATVLHEVVAHKGLRKLFGERFDTFLDNVYNNVDANIRAEIDALAEKYGNTREATEEYLASLAEDTRFEKVDATLWGRIKQWFLNMLAEAGIKLDFELSDNELRYILWRSYQNLANPGRYNIVKRIEDVAVRARLGIGEYAPASEEIVQVAEEDTAEYTSEEQQIIADAKANGSYMKAPNGQPTKLNEKQWAQVRTANFKKWFGDWEKASRIEKLKKSKPIEITGQEIKPSEDIKQYKQNALEYGKTLRGEYTNADTGASVQVNAQSIKEVLHHDYKDVEHLQSVAAIPMLIERGVYIDTVANEGNDAKSKVKEYQYYVCGLKIGGVDYTVKLVIAVDNNGNRYYDHKLTEIEKSKLLDELDRITSPSSQEENALSAIKDKRLLSILQTNSSKIVDENGEPMVVYHRTPKEFTSFDKEKIGSSTDWGAFGKGFYLSPADFGSIYGANLMSLFVNVKNPLVLNDANAFDVKQPFFSKDYSWRREQSENFTEWVKDSGYDGVWYIEGTGRDEIVAFEPNQMKSASDNTGDFSENENDIRFRERDDVASEEGKETIDDIPTRPMTLMERVKASLLEASAKNKENLKLRRDALRNLGQDLANVLKLMRAQRTYDKSTVETLRVIAKMYFKDAQLLDKLTPYEVTRIMSLLKRSVGKGYRFDEASKLLDILFNAHNKALAEVLAQTEKVKAKKVNAAGVEVMGRLDKYGQELVETYRGAKDLDMERIDEMIAESNNELNDAREGVRSAFGLTETDDVDVIVADYDSTDKVKSDAADVYMQERARYEGLRLAKEYRETILTSKGEISELKKELRDIEAKFRRGEVDGKLFHELRDALWMNILEADAEVIDGYHSVIGALAHDVRESSLRAKAFVQAQIDRAQEIQHDANSDMQGRNADVQGTHPDKWNNSAVRAVMSAMPTFQTMLKKFGEQAVDGKGYLYNRFMPQVTMAADNEFRGRVAAREAIEAKLKDIYGDKKMDIGRFMDLSRKDGVSVMYIEGKEMKEFKLTKGQMLYIYMVDKMTDGEMKLRKMGITEDAVAEIAKNLDEQMIQFADWMQGEFLSDLRTKYNAVHERMFGAPMAAIENYFPLKIKKEARGEKGDVSQQNSEDKPSTVTGSIIKRTKNTTALDLSADAMSVLLEHIDNMEHWAAFAEFNRDLNTLLNYRRFQNQVKNMTTLRYGSGDVLWRNFKDVAAVAAGEYRPTKSEFDKALLNIAKGVTASKINFRFYTAAKQILSAPAFWTGAAPQYFAKCYTNPKGSWEWAIDNLPGFKERWESRAMGNEKLLEDESDWKVWRNKFVAGATRWGMSANAAVDALTVAMGARAVYLDKYNELKKAGYSEQKADEKARQTAAEAYNESQQSSESAYLSPLQKSGTVVSAIFTTFKNSNFGYTRKTAQAIANIIRKTKGDKEKTIAFMAKQMARDGLTPAQAKAYATKLYNRGLWKDYADAALFGFGLQLMWELGGAAIYLIGGDDDEKKDAMMQEAAVRATMGTLQGLPLGETAANAVMAVMAGDAEKFRLPELVAVGDIRNVAQAMDTDAVRGATEVVNMLTSIGIGVTPQVLTDILVACNELGKSPEEFGTFLLRFMNAPQSQLEALTIDKAMEEFAKNSAEVGKEYVEYRMDKNVPYFQWLYSDEGEQKAIERYAKRFDKLLDERLDFVVEDATAYDLFYDGAQPGTKKVLSEKRQDYLAGDEAAEFLKRDTKAIVEETLYGKREINTAYFEMSTAEDEDMEFLIKKARKNLEGKAEATVAQKSLLKRINSNNNAINKLKRAMQTDPTNKVKYMERIRAIRTKLVDLINNSDE